MKVTSVSVVDLVNDGDGGMLQPRRRFRFGDESTFAPFVTQEVGREDFESDLTVQLGVPCAVDDTHAPAADLLEDLVVRQGTSDHGCSRVWALF